jgi:hypothetical protein
MIGWTSRTIFLSIFEHFAWTGVKFLHYWTWRSVKQSWTLNLGICDTIDLLGCLLCNETGRYRKFNSYLLFGPKVFLFNEPNHMWSFC